MKYFILFSAFLSLFFFIALFEGFNAQKQADLQNITVQSLDGEIRIKWDCPNPANLSSITVTIANGTDDYHEQIVPYINFYSFTKGKHGVSYTISLRSNYKDNSHSPEYQTVAQFVEYDKLPDLPLISINTVNGMEPDYNIFPKEDETLWGETITDNEYVSGDMTMTQQGTQPIESQVMIKIRGNTSSIFLDKKSYKLKLSEPIDLLSRGSKYADKEWILLNWGTSLNAYIGYCVGTLCGMEWQPELKYVNVMLNNDWKGCYVLIESIKPGVTKCNISKTGYIIENDVYFWKSEDKYFKTDNQIHQMGYTFKYPEIRSIEDISVIRIKEYMNQLENLILCGDETYADFLDINSAVSWILVRDILGQSDGGGCNMFFTKYDFEENDPTSSKLKMGPLWDFDSSFLMENEWSQSHTSAVFYFPQLFNMENFLSTYRFKWNDIRDTLYEKIEQDLSELWSENGVALQKSWDLDANRWNSGKSSLDGSISNILNWFKKRIYWISDTLEGDI